MAVTSFQKHKPKNGLMKAKGKLANEHLTTIKSRETNATKISYRMGALYPLDNRNFSLTAIAMILIIKDGGINKTKYFLLKYEQIRFYL